MRTLIQFTFLILWAFILLACEAKKKYSILDSVEIPVEEIDKVVEEEMRKISETYMTIDDKKYSPLEVDLDDGALVISFEDGIVFLGFDLLELKPDGNIKIALGEYSQNNGELKIKEKSVYKSSGLQVIQKEDNYKLKGDVKDSLNQESHRVEIAINESVIGGGTTRLQIENDKAILTGVLGTRSYVQIKDLITNHPKIKTMILQHVPGSMNDAVNMHTGRLIKNAGYKIVVPADGMIASGGVDLFCAGRERVVEPGAKLGIHSWCCYEDKTAGELQQEHPAHKAQVNYFTEMLGESGKAFYFHTLEAAPFDSIHWMTKDELSKWHVATKIIKNKNDKSGIPADM